jgi:outer membrane murein-binding lipoprotein Lpp
MSMRQQVGQKDIEDFLLQVGRTRQPGRLYLTGGAALVHRGIRAGQTLDIDIQITSDPANLTAQIAQLKQKMNMNIKDVWAFSPLETKSPSSIQKKS